MSFEKRLGRVRLEVPVAGVRLRVLKVVRSVRHERRLWRWTWAAATAILAASIPLNREESKPIAPLPRNDRGEWAELVPSAHLQDRILAHTLVRR